MHVRFRADWSSDKSKQSGIIPLSKKTSIEELRQLLQQKIDLEPDLQRLFYKGKELVDGQILNDYSVVQNDVIVVMKRFIVQDTGQESINKCNNNESASTELIVAQSKYYKIGDSVDVRLSDSHAWFEAQIKKILKPTTEVDNDDNLIFLVRLEDHASVLLCEEETRFENIRPPSYYTYKVSELKADMTVLANYNLDSPRERGFWYDFTITEASANNLRGMLHVGDEKLLECRIKFVDECMRIEPPELMADKLFLSSPKTGRKYPFNCKRCKDDKSKACTECSCQVCGGKQDSDKIILCDECDSEYHLDCLEPPLNRVPDDDWYCADCKTDDSQIVKAGEKVKISKKKLKMPSQTRNTKKDWGRGMACVGLTRTNDNVPKTHVGAIPGVEVGFCWKFRLGVAESGVHRPPVAGIHGKENDCAYSVVLSGGYEDDIDYGEEFFYTGAGGRDLSGNKRTGAQSFDQELTRTNKALALNCNAKLNTENGAEATDWRAGKPVRVVRSYKLGKHSKYAPADGYRYDGLYKVVKYYPEKGKSGYIVWRYLLRRDDPAPSPWTRQAKKFEMIYPEGYLELQQLKQDDAKVEVEEDEEEEPVVKEPSEGKKRKAVIKLDIQSLCRKKLKPNEFELQNDVRRSIKNDKINAKLWDECTSMLSEGKVKFLAKVDETFRCFICIKLVFEPVTLICGHTLCMKCLKVAFKHCDSERFNCPLCRKPLEFDEALECVNDNLREALNLLFPGYGGV